MFDIQPWQAARKILCIRLDSLGDVLMTTPAIRALKESGLDRTITLLTSKSGAEVARLVPEIQRTIVYDAPWMKATRVRTDSSPDFQMASRLREQNFDGAVIFTVFSQNPLPAALLAYLADIPLRLAYCRENPYQLLTHWVAETDPGEDGKMRHEVRRHLDLVAAIGSFTGRESLSLRVPDNAHRRVRRILAGQGLDLSCPWVVIHPGATASSRRYRPEGFAYAGRELAAKHGMQVVFTGDLPEVPLVEEVRKLMAHPSFTLAGRLDLVDFSALIALAPLLISNNTGPVHIAAAVGTPVVDIYALTNPQHTPWAVPHRLLYHDVPCKYCYKSACPMGHHDCLRLVSPELIVQAALELVRDVSSLSDVSSPAEISLPPDISSPAPTEKVRS